MHLKKDKLLLFFFLLSGFSFLFLIKRCFPEQKQTILESSVLLISTKHKKLKSQNWFLQQSHNPYGEQKIVMQIEIPYSRNVNSQITIETEKLKKNNNLELCDCKITHTGMKKPIKGNLIMCTINPYTKLLRITTLFKSEILISGEIKLSKPVTREKYQEKEKNQHGSIDVFLNWN